MEMVACAISGLKASDKDAKLSALKAVRDQVIGMKTKKRALLPCLPILFEILEGSDDLLKKEVNTTTSCCPCAVRPCMHSIQCPALQHRPSGHAHTPAHPPHIHTYSPRHASTLYSPHTYSPTPRKARAVHAHLQAAVAIGSFGCSKEGLAEIVKHNGLQALARAMASKEVLPAAVRSIKLILQVN